MLQIGWAHNRPLLWFGACFAAGAAAAGTRPRALAYGVLAAAVGAAAMSAAAGVRAAARQPGRHGGRAGPARHARPALFALGAAAMAFAGCARCAAVWLAHMERYAWLDGRDITVSCRVASGIAFADGRLRVEVAPIELLGGGGAGGSGGGGGSVGGGGGGAEIERGRMLLSIDAGAQNPVDWGIEGEQELRDALRYGREITVSGRLAKPARQQNRYLFDYERYLYARGISATINAIPAGVAPARGGAAGAPRFSLVGAGIGVQSRAERALYGALPSRDAALLAAIAVGKSDGVDEETRGGFEAAGLLHLMAVSGAHVAIVAGLASLLLKKAGAGIRGARIGAFAAALAFVFVAGFSASVVRAAVAFGAATAAKLLRKGFDGLSALGLAALALLALNPMQVFSAGFALSFSCAASISVLAPHAEAAMARARLPKGAKGAAAVSVSVQAGVLPLQVAFFNSFPLLSIPANILASPVVGVALASAQATALSGMAWPPLARAPAAFAEACVVALRAVAGAAAGVPGAVLRAGSLGAVRTCAYYAALLLACGALGASARHGARGGAGRGADDSSAAPGTDAAPAPCRDGGARAWAFAAACAVAALAGAAAADGIIERGRMEVVFLDVGNANAAYVDVAGMYNVLVDAGGRTRFGQAAADGLEEPGGGERRLSDYLVGRGVRRIDVAIATHGDADHIEGFYQVIDELRVVRLLIPEAGLGADSGELRALAEYAEARGVSVEACAQGDVYELGGASRLEILSPPRGADADGSWIAKPTGNDLSLVAALSFGTSRALFCGDIGDAAERRLVADGTPLRAQLMGVPHHGSKYSSGSVFLEAVSPSVAVAGVGRNSYGHPTAEAVARYVEAGASLLRTDEDGMVTVMCGKDGAMRASCYNGWENQYIFLAGGCIDEHRHTEG